jgi:large exoprotein involved in heme utilization and adhesion
VTLRAPRILVDGGAVATAAVPLVSGGEGGAGGAITLDARELLVQGGGQVNASSFGKGDAGRIEVGATESIRVEGTGSGIVSRTGASGRGGDVALHAPRIEVASGGEVSTRSAQGLGEVEDILASLRDDGLLARPPDLATGNAGLITLTEAQEVLLTGRGRIATNAEAAGGGDIRIDASKLVHLIAGDITASVQQGGDGGKITIDPVFVILQDGSSIVANAGVSEGNGGTIRITTENYFAFPGSTVRADAPSKLGVDGTVEINAADVDLAGSLGELPANFLDAASRMRERCGARQSGERTGSFAVKGAGGIPAEPDGPLPASMAPAATTAGSERTALAASAPSSLLAEPALLLPASCP